MSLPVGSHDPALSVGFAMSMVLVYTSTEVTLNLIFWANGKEKRIITRHEDIRYDSVHNS